MGRAGKSTEEEAAGLPTRLLSIINRALSRLAAGMPYFGWAWPRRRVQRVVHVCPWRGVEGAAGREGGVQALISRENGPSESGVAEKKSSSFLEKTYGYDEPKIPPDPLVRTNHFVMRNR